LYTNIADMANTNYTLINPTFLFDQINHGT